MKILKVLALFCTVAGLTAGLSHLSTLAWAEKAEKIGTPPTIQLESGMSIREFGETYKVPKSILKDVFSLKAPADLETKVGDKGFDQATLQVKLNKAYAFEAEESSKSWVKILLKFVLWFLWLGFAFRLLTKNRIGHKRRVLLYGSTVLLFGVILGADPGPMGTVKDAIVLFGKSGIIFPPRMIALSAFLLTVFLANKFICSWGCQAGALQDLLFRINSKWGKEKPLLEKYKVPFVVSNSVRVLFFVVFSAAALGWGYDLIGPVDPFKVFKPLTYTALGAGFVFLLLLASLFIYRPWCHFLCPFGLIGWLLEKVSVFKVKVDYDKCVACGSCAKACPSTVMSAILVRDKTIPDCFSCGNCLEACPKNAITFGRGARQLPPKGKFDNL